MISILCVLEAPGKFWNLITTANGVRRLRNSRTTSNKSYALRNQHHRASGSRGQGSGFSGRTNTWRRDTGAAGPKGGAAPPRKQHVRSSSASEGQCNRCGSKDHWSKSCHASANIVVVYKKYKELMEVNSTENNGVEHKVTFKVADPNEQCSNLDAPDFDVTS